MWQCSARNGRIYFTANDFCTVTLWLESNRHHKHSSWITTLSLNRSSIISVIFSACHDINLLSKTATRVLCLHYFRTWSTEWNNTVKYKDRKKPLQNYLWMNSEATSVMNTMHFQRVQPKQSWWTGTLSAARWQSTQQRNSWLGRYMDH